MMDYTEGLATALLYNMCARIAKECKCNVNYDNPCIVGYGSDQPPVYRSLQL